MNRPPTPDVVENAPEREPTLQELINIKVSSVYLFFLFQVSIAVLIFGGTIIMGLEG